jgi:hypothetical protein
MPSWSSTCRRRGGRLPDKPRGSAMEVFRDLLVFLALVVVGLLVLNLLARRR